jgi:hypothetical protein
MRVFLFLGWLFFGVGEKHFYLFVYVARFVYLSLRVFYLFVFQQRDAVVLVFLLLVFASSWRENPIHAIHLSDCLTTSRSSANVQSGLSL